MTYTVIGIKRKGRNSEPPLFPSFSFNSGPFLMGKHILNENSIPLGRVLHKYVGNGPDKHAVLDDRAAAHALNDSAGKGQKLRIRHFNYHALTFVSGGIIHLQDLNIVIFYRPG